jgi:DNA modification methylase
LKKLVANDKIDMVFTDPPYDFDKDDKIASIIDLATHNSHIFIMHDDKGIVNYLRNSNFNFKRFFVLDIKIASPRGNDPYLRHILVSHEQKGDPIKHENQHDGLSSIIPINYRKNLKEERLHNHQKSIESITKFIKHYSKREQNILDLFGGSGSTLIACEQLERNCYMMELEPHNCDIIIKRFEEFTGEKAIKIKD